MVEPRTGIRAEGLMSVTEIAPEAVADAYSTVVLALGRDGLDWLAAHAGVEAMAVTDEGQVVTTAGFDRHRTA